MAGRLRTQLKKLDAIRKAAIDLRRQIHESAPNGILSTDTYGDWLKGKVTEKTADRWHRMLNGAVACYASAEDLQDMLKDRIAKLPTDRSPAPRPPNER